MQRRWKDVCCGHNELNSAILGRRMRGRHSFWLSSWPCWLEFVIVKADTCIPAGLDPVNHTKESPHSSLSFSTLTEESVPCSDEEYWAKLCCPIITVLACKSGYLFMLDLDNKKMFGVHAQSGQYVHHTSSWTLWCSCHLNVSCGPLKSFSRRTHFSKHRGNRSFFYLNFFLSLSSFFLYFWKGRLNTVFPAVQSRRSRGQSWISVLAAVSSVRWDPASGTQDVSSWLMIHEVYRNGPLEIPNNFHGTSKCCHLLDQK